jgi:hypothetical protein
MKKASHVRWFLEEASVLLVIFTLLFATVLTSYLVSHAENTTLETCTYSTPDSNCESGITVCTGYKDVTGACVYQPGYSTCSCHVFSCPTITCEYSQKVDTSVCASALQIVPGYGCSGFNCEGCTYPGPSCSSPYCATSSPTPTSQQTTASPTPTPTLKPTPTASLNPSPTPTPKSSNNTLPSPTQTYAKPTPTPIHASVQTDIELPKSINPEVKLLSDSDASATVALEVKSSPGSIAEFHLQPLHQKENLLYIGRVITDKPDGKAVFFWDTTHTPNGTYVLLTTIYYLNGTQGTVSPSNVIVNNIHTASAQRSSVRDIVIPKEEDIKNIPVDPQVVISKIENVEVEKDKVVIKLQGKSLPNSYITLIIHSNPIVVTVKTDSNGLWTYNLERPLSPGKHTTYVALVNPEGNRIRSEIKEFFISTTFAASSNNESLVLTSASFESPQKKFIYSTIIIIAASIGSLLFIAWSKNRSIKRI